MALTDEIEEHMKLTKRQLAILDILPRHLAGCDRLGEIYETMERDLGAERPNGLGYAPVTVLERVLFPQLYSAKYGQPLEGENNFRHYSAKDKPVPLDPEVFQRLQTQDKTTNEGTTYFPFRATRLLKHTLLGVIEIERELPEAEINMLKDYAKAVGVELSPRYFRKERERVRQEQEKALLKKRKELSELMGTAIHYVRGRLQSLSQPAYLVRRQLEDGHPSKVLAEGVEKRLVSVGRELEYFQEVFNAGEATKMPTNLYTIIEEIMAEERLPLLQAQGTALVNELERSQYLATIDPMGIRFAFFELLHNAMKYSPRGAEISVRGEREFDRVSLYFKNTGVQIPESELPLIFERNHGHGSGLGLADVKRIIEKEHNGKMTVQSADNEVVFIVELPLAS